MRAAFRRTRFACPAECGAHSVRCIAGRNDMDILKHYLNRANEIIGERTAEEAKYDREVIRWLRKGKDIKKSIAKANEKYPTEAIQLDDSNLADVQSHYEYQAEHEAIMEKFNTLNT